MPAEPDRYRAPAERYRLGDVLIQNIRLQHDRLKALLEKVTGHWDYEDGVYRFYHQSFKVYGGQHATMEVVEALRSVAPEGIPFCRMFREILENGTGREFSMEVNDDWVRQTSPILQAFFHALYFLQMAVKYGAELEKVPQVMPSGVAALLCLYDIR
jgi:hypothetical protein